MLTRAGDPKCRLRGRLGGKRPIEVAVRAPPHDAEKPHAGDERQTLSTIYADIAQLVEQRPCKSKVGGSSPPVGTKFNNRGNNKWRTIIVQTVVQAWELITVLAPNVHHNGCWKPGVIFKNDTGKCTNRCKKSTQKSYAKRLKTSFVRNEKNTISFLRQVENGTKTKLITNNPRPI